MIRTPARFTIRALLGALICTGVVGVLCFVLPAGAGAYATVEGPPVYSSAPGLPDGRVYEQVSPADKDGNEAGSSTSAFKTGALNSYGIASPEGTSVLFEGTGPMGESPWAGSLWFVAERNREKPCPGYATSPGSGWCTRAVLPAAQQPLAAIGGILETKGSELVEPSLDLSRTMLETTGNQTLAPTPGALCRTNRGVDGNQLYLAGPDPFSPATWLAKPEVKDPVESCQETAAGAPAGGTPNFSTVYFAYPGTLLPADFERTPHVVVHGTQYERTSSPWGFYEYQEGALREAGVLPNGKLDPFGAVPAASGHGANRVGNEVSESGTRAFFVSPDPASCEQNGGHNDCATDPPELYVRENGERTVLVSRDALLPEAEGLLAAAPSGVTQMRNPTRQSTEGGLAASYLFASPDGSQAFFQSEDDLTSAAAEASPGSDPKTYDFDLDADTLTYLPGVASGEILATDRDGSAFAFIRPEEASEPAELEWWSAGPDGGHITPVVQLAVGSISDAQVSSDGSALVFVTAASLSSAFNSGPDEQVYRYDSSTSRLGCVSCAPAGVPPRGGESGNAWISSQVASELDDEHNEPSRTVSEPRAISPNGDVIFFDTPSPLVPQDSNTNSPGVIRNEDETRPQGRDVYEWENGAVYLISTGKSPLDSFLLGASEDGSNVFFAAAEGLVPGDTDGGYDVYDARVTRPGESTSVAVPCEGSVCQGPPSVPSPLAAPASATFSGLGNPAPEVAASTTVTGKTTTKAVKCKWGFTRKQSKCVKRKAGKKARKASSDRGVKS